MKKTCVTISLIAALLTIGLADSAFAVTSKITRHSTAAKLLKGQAKDVIIDSEGTVKLARKSAVLKMGSSLDKTWTINCMTADAKGNIYLGTGPNGKIVKYSDGQASVIYQPEPPPVIVPQPQNDDPNAADTKDDPNSINAEDNFANEHVFAMAIDAGDRLLAAVSGNNCRLLRIDNGQVETIYEPDDVIYILAIAVDQMGNIYLGTGPKGHVYRLDPFGGNPELIYDSQDKNILSLAIDPDGHIYAGSDQRGLIYKIDQKSKSATVLFDSAQKEITSLLLDDEGNLYASATSALAAANQSKFNSIAANISSGRPDSKTKESPKKDSSTKSLKTATSKERGSKDQQDSPDQTPRGVAPKSASHIYKIDTDGFVTDIFGETAVFFSLIEEDGHLLLGTGNKAELFSIDTKTEQKAVAYSDEKASQITAMIISKNKVYLATANPARLIELSTDLAETGTYTSDLVDAGQPAKWGKLQLNADIDKDCKILMAARSGNVKDPNDPTFSGWTDDVEISDAVQLTCPIGRFCQYRLTLKTKDAAITPVIREIAIPHLVPNQAPKVLNIKTARSKDPKKVGFMNIGSKTKDRNGDKLVYTIELKKIGRQRWVKIKDEFAKSSYEWNTRTVEDGEYEVRVTADDKLSNTPATKLSGSRISDPFIVDNTAPAITKEQVVVKDQTATLRLTLEDEFSVIGKVIYTVDSDENWSSSLPDDLVHDTTAENFTIVTDELEPGQHIIAVRVADDLGNTAYKTYAVEVE